MGAVNQLQGQGLGMAKDMTKTTDDIMKKVRYMLCRRGHGKLYVNV